MNRHVLRVVSLSILMVLSVLSAITVTARPAAACLGSCDNDTATLYLFNESNTTTVYGHTIHMFGFVRDSTTTCNTTSDCDVATGSITISNGATVLTTAPLSTSTDNPDRDAVFTADFSNLPTGVYEGANALTLHYVPSGSDPFESTNDVKDERTVTAAPTTTTLAVDSTSTSLGQNVKMTATVSDQGGIDLAHGAHLPSGDVEFLVDGASVASATLSGGSPNTAVLNWTLLDVGTHQLSARFSGDFDYDTSTSSPTISHAVTKGAVTNVLTQSAATTVYGQPFDLTATVAPVAPATITPTGSVNFNDFTPPTCLCTLPLSSGVAKYVGLTSLAAGSHTLGAGYNGDDNFNTKDSATITHVVNKASTTTGISASASDPLTFGEPVTFTANVAVVAPGAGTPTAGVQFYDNGAPLGSPVPLNSLMNAAFTTSALGGGTHHIVATYVGDANFASSTSAEIVRTVPCAKSVTGRVSGSYTASGSGLTCIANAEILGQLNVSSGASVSIVNSTVGSYTTLSGANTFIACNSEFHSLFNATNGSIAQLGDGGACGGNKVFGNAAFSSNGVVILARNRFNGTLTVNNTFYETRIQGNKVNGRLACSGNAPPTNNGEPNTAGARNPGQCAAPF